MTRFSAWDVAGAVCWTALAAWGWLAIMPRVTDGIEIGVPAVTVAAVYCWARLLGARER